MSGAGSPPSHSAPLLQKTQRRVLVLCDPDHECLRLHPGDARRSRACERSCSGPIRRRMVIDRCPVLVYDQLIGVASPGVCHEVCQGGRPELSNAAEPVPENTPARRDSDLQSAPYPLTHTYLPGFTSRSGAEQRRPEREGWNDPPSLISMSKRSCSAPSPFCGTEGRRGSSDAVAGDEARDLARMGTGFPPLVGSEGEGFCGGEESMLGRVEDAITWSKASLSAPLTEKDRASPLMAGGLPHAAPLRPHQGRWQNLTRGATRSTEKFSR